MGCAGGCAKAILIILNIIVSLLGIALTALGILGLVGGEFVKKAVSAAVQAIPGIAASFNFADSSDGSQPTSDEAADAIMQFLKDIAVPLLVIGIILTVITFAGMCGACCNSKCLLSVYIVCLVIITVALIVLLPLYATGTLDPQLKSFLTASVKDNYVRVDKFTALNLAWTVVMVELKCCGVSNYTDFYENSVWQRNRTVTITQAGGQRFNTTVYLIAPFACCKMNDQREPIQPETCAIIPTDVTSNFRIGCFGKMKEQLKKYDKYVIGVVAGIIVFLILLIIFAVIIIRENDNKVM